MSWTFDNKKTHLFTDYGENQASDCFPYTGTQSTTSNRARAGQRGRCQSKHHQRALSDLEREGFVYSKRTTGRFVTEDKELIAQSRKQLSEEELEHFVSSMTHFGYEKEELPGVVGDYIKGV